MGDKHINRLCVDCTQPCKQLDNVTIAYCPNKVIANITKTK